MKKNILALFLFLMCASNAATVVWDSMSSTQQTYDHNMFLLCAEYPGLYEGTLVVSTPSEIFVLVENVDARHFRLVFSHEMYGSYENWIVAQKNSLVDASTTRLLQDEDYLLHYMLDDDRYLGAKDLIVEANVGLYLAFVCSDVIGYSDPSKAPVVYGWVELVVDDNGNVTASSSAADLDGGPMIVGGGAWTGGIPEPSGGMLLLIGVAVLGLRRRTNRPIML